MLKKGVVFVYCFLLAYQLAAQSPVSPRAQGLYNQALNYKADHQATKAYDALLKALKETPSFDAAYSLLGNWYMETHDYQQASKLYQRAVNNCRDGHKNFGKLLTVSYLKSGQPTEALREIQAHGITNPEWQELDKQAFFAVKAMMHPVADTVFNMGIRVNTPMSEAYPWIASDGRSILFTRNTNGIDQDFYRSDADSCGGWLSGRYLPYPLNTSSQEWGQMISIDGHYLFFTRCDNHSENGWAEGGCDLFMAYAADSSPWSAPQSFGATINTPGYEAMPCLSSDNRELYFVSDRPGGMGGLDIWVTRFDHGLWQAPRNLGPKINTKGNETSPFLCPDNETLFFTSDGQMGMGGTDLFRCQKTGDTTWSKPVNLGYPINTSYDEQSICLTRDGKHAYFASNRDSSGTNYDLYEMNLPKELQPKPVTFVRGYVYDTLSEARLNYVGIFVNDKNDHQLYHYTSNRGDGSYLITIPTGVKYKLSISRIGYQEMEDSLYFDNSFQGKYSEHNIAMLPDGYERPAETVATTDSTIFTAYFATNSLDIADSAKTAMLTTFASLLNVANIQIIVNGYTDNTGTPIINEQVSYKRANTIAKELTDMGFNPGIIVTQGWGEANPKVPNDTEEQRGQNRRVEIIIRKQG